MDAARLKEQFELRVREQIREHSKLLYYPRRFAEMVERDDAFIAADHVFNEGMVEGMPRQAGFELPGKPVASTSPSNGWCGPNRVGSLCSARHNSATSSSSPRIWTFPSGRVGLSEPTAFRQLGAARLGVATKRRFEVGDEV